MDWFKTTHFACYQDNAIKWTCVDGFDSWTDADYYSQYHQEYKNKQTTLIRVNNIWPNYIKTLIISNQLRPYVDLKRV